MKKLRNSYGFSMLPLILTLFLVVGIISAGFLMLGPKASGQRVTDTTANLDSMASTVISWSATTRALPTMLAPVFTSTPRDSWGNNILYIFATSLTSTATGGICGRQTTNLELTVNGALTPNIAFVLLSSAGNALQSTWTGLPALNPAVTEYGSSLIGTPRVILAYSTPGDLFKVVTLEELKNRAGCYGSTQGRLKILNNELPSACSGSSYSTTLYASGGVPSYTWTTTTPGWSIDFSSGILSNPAPAAGQVVVTLTDLQGSISQHTYNFKVISCSPTPSPAPS